MYDYDGSAGSKAHAERVFLCGKIIVHYSLTAEWSFIQTSFNSKSKIKIMRTLILILLFSLATGCISSVAGNDTNSLTEPAASLKAIYLTHGPGQLAVEDLEDHPEIIVIDAFDELKPYTSQKIAVWIDKNATPLDSEQERWINEAPQAYYPMVLVGTSDTLYAFRDLLRLCCFMGPGIVDPGYDAPGFSVIQRKQTNEPEAPSVLFLQGYNQSPNVQVILEFTNSLLEGKLSFTPTVPSVPALPPTP